VIAGAPARAELNGNGQFLGDVVAGLASKPKTLSPQYFYDDIGSALFEAITSLPEYGLTRADESILRANAGAIAELTGSGARVVELGSGNGRKTRWILEALERPEYHPIDVSLRALDQCSRDLEPFASVTPFHGDYLDGVRSVMRARGRERLLVLFLGSTIGNFHPREARLLLRQVRNVLRNGDVLLIGFDLMNDPVRLEPAYDDPAGVTAAFNRNVLARINRELGGGFDLRDFTHQACYNARERRIEMHLRCLRRCKVPVAAAARAFTFERGETILTECSYKFRAPDLPLMASQCGFRQKRHWVDAEWPFAESLWEVAVR